MRARKKSPHVMVVMLFRGGRELQRVAESTLRVTNVQSCVSIDDCAER